MPENPERAILHVDMDAFYASVEQHDFPELSGRPVIVGGLGRRGVVAAASYEARAFGVHSAMPVARARRLAPAANYVRPRIARYREVSKQVFAVFHELTPQVEGLSLDEAFLDVTASLRLFGSREEIGEIIRTRIKERTGLQASVGMAHNKFLAKLASDARKPHGFVSVDREKVRAFLDPMPIGCMWGIGKKTEPRLRAMGILTIGQLRTCDPAVLKNVLGNRTGRYLELARGEDDREVSPGREDKSISHEVTFEQNLTDPSDLAVEIQKLAEAVGRRVRQQKLAARTIHLKLRDHRFKTYTRSLTIRAPSDSTQTYYRIAKSLMTRWLKSHANVPVRLLGVGVSGLESREGHSEATPGIDRIMDNIADRFGEHSLVHGQVLKKKP